MIKDQDIREPLFEFLEEKYGKNRILEEHMMGKSRADIVMVTDSFIYGIEIKSDADTYARLSRQVKDYDKYYDRNIVVAGSSHGLHIREHVPEYWGVITVEEMDGELDFYTLREPTPNPKVKWKQKLMILWRPELARIQERYHMPKYKEKSKSFVQGKICEWIEKGKIAEEELTQEMCEILFQRDYTTIAETLSEYRKVKHRHRK